MMSVENYQVILYIGRLSCGDTEHYFDNHFKGKK